MAMPFADKEFILKFCQTVGIQCGAIILLLKDDFRNSLIFQTLNVALFYIGRELSTTEKKEFESIGDRNGASFVVHGCAFLLFVKEKPIQSGLRDKVIKELNTFLEKNPSNETSFPKVVYEFKMKIESDLTEKQRKLSIEDQKFEESCFKDWHILVQKPSWFETRKSSFRATVIKDWCVLFKIIYYLF